MRLQWLLYMCCLSMCFVLIGIFTIEEQPAIERMNADTQEITVSYEGHGVAHKEFGTMLQGGSGEARHSHILWLGWFFGAVISIFFVLVLAFGARQQDKVGDLAKPLFIGGIVYTLIWTAMVWTYADYMKGNTEGRFLLLPIPTAWMVYGYWLMPCFFIVLFIWAYPKYFWPPDTEAKFKAIIDAKNERDGGAA